MTIPSLRLIRHANSILFNRIIARKLCEKTPEFSIRTPPGFLQLAKSGELNPAKFSDLPLHKDFKTILNEHGFRYMTPVQEETIPELLKNRCVYVVTETGSGKTLSYLIPIVNSTYTGSLRKFRGNGVMKPSIVIVTVSRGNGFMINQRIRDLIRPGSIRVLHEFGNPADTTKSSPPPTFNDVKHDCDVFISSPVRIEEKIHDNALSLDRLKLLVLDDIGQYTAKSVLNSAMKLASNAGKDCQVVMTGCGFVHPYLVRCAPLRSKRFFDEQKQATPKSISQRFEIVNDLPLSEARLIALLEELANLKNQRGIIYCSQLEVAKCLESELFHRGFKTTPYHRDLKPIIKDKALQQFNQKTSQILVSTPMAACVDLKDVDFVINYELPYTLTNYLHQVGRCGRIGQPGTSVTFATREDITKRGYIPILSRGNEISFPENFQIDSNVQIPNTDGDVHEENVAIK